MVNPATQRPTRVAWISDFPVEWLPDAPACARDLPRHHPATWEAVLRDEFEKRDDIELHICVLRKQVAKDETFKLGRTTFHLCKVAGGIRAPSLFWADTLVLKRKLAEISPDLVHAWGTERGAALVASRLKYPYLVTIQGLLSWYRELVPLTRYERFAAWIETWSLRRARVITTESRFAVKYLSERYPKCRVVQAEHASNWVFHQVVRTPQIRPPRILCVGTLGYRKGSDLLLRALSRLTDEFAFEVLVIGSPNEGFLAPLRHELSPELWKRVEFRSNLTQAQIAAEFATATMLFLPTRADTSPNAVKEAAVAGIPVVASAIGGIPDYIHPGQNGLLFPSEDLNAFTTTIRQAFTHPLFSQGQVDPETHAKVKAYLSPVQMAENFWGAYGLLTQAGDRGL